MWKRDGADFQRGPGVCDCIPPHSTSASATERKMTGRRFPIRRFALSAVNRDFRVGGRRLIYSACPNKCAISRVEKVPCVDTISAFLSMLAVGAQDVYHRRLKRWAMFRRGYTKTPCANPGLIGWANFWSDL